MDQVRQTADGDVSVPINMAYNHHHDAYVVGKGSKMERVRYDPLDLSVSPMARADPEYMLVAVEHTPSPRGLPTSAHLAAGNGGEYRKSCVPPVGETPRRAPQDGSMVPLPALNLRAREK